MSKIELLLARYSQFLDQFASKNPQASLFQFESIIKRFTQNDSQPFQRHKYLSSHLQFLFQALSQLPQPSNSQFTTALQILNYLLRSTLLQQLKIPINLLNVLAFHLSTNQVYKNSEGVIANVIWLICRCLQICRDREQFMRSVGESGVVQHCIESKSFEELSQRGVLLLINYLCKRQLESKQIYLTLLKNVQKFREAWMWSSVLALLRTDRSLYAIQQSPLCQQQLRRVLVLYLNQLQVAQSFFLQNDKLLILATNLEDQTLEALRIQNILQLYLTQPTIELEKNYLNKVFKIYFKIFANPEKLDKYLNLAIRTLYSNQISRRIFVLYHQRINYKQFIDILKGDYPKRLSTRFQSSEEGNNRLKFLICMKRIAKRLQIGIIYDYKLKPLAEKHLQKEHQLQLNEQLIELLKEVTQEEQQSYIE